MDSQQIELAGRAWLESRLTQAGFEVARPARDKGVDLIVFQDEAGLPFHAVPIQLKVATERIFSVDKKYAGRGIVMAYVWHAFSPAPRLFLVAHDEAVYILSEETRNTYSWRVRGAWATTRPSKAQEKALARHEQNFECLRPVRNSGPGARPAIAALLETTG